MNDIVKRAKEGESQALEELIHMYEIKMYKFIVLHLQILLVLFLLHLSLLNHAFDLLLMLINKQPQTCYCYYFLPAYHQVPCLQLA